MPKEHQGELAFSYLWREVMAQNNDDSVIEQISSINYDRGMFECIWLSTVNAFIHTFDTTEDPIVLQKMIVGLTTISKIGSDYKLLNVCDVVVNLLFKISGVLRPVSGNEMDYSDGDKKAKFIDPWNVYFGKFQRGHLAILVAFSIVNDISQTLSNGLLTVHYVC